MKSNKTINELVMEYNVMYNGKMKRVSDLTLEEAKQIIFLISA